MNVGQKNIGYMVGSTIVYVSIIISLMVGVVNMKRLWLGSRYCLAAYGWG